MFNPLYTQNLVQDVNNIHHSIRTLELTIGGAIDRSGSGVSIEQAFCGYEDLSKVEQDELHAILVIFLMRKLLLFIVMVLLSMLLLSVDFIHKRCYFMISFLLFMNMVEFFCS
jgi:hypothetical protein